VKRKTRSTIASLTGLALLLSSAPTALAAGPCEWPVTPRVIHRDAHSISEVWSFAEDPALWGHGVPASSAYAALIGWIRSKVDPDQRVLLSRQRTLFEEAGYAADVSIFDLILSARAGEIQEVACLDALLLTEHTARFPLQNKPTELQAFVLSRPESSQVRIYLGSWDRDVSAPSPESVGIMLRLQADVADGWVFRAQLHNHPFYFENSTGDIGGTTIPSAPDANSYVDYAKTLGLQEARITNGVSTLRIPASQFSLFVRSP
jgi:hypothetical protein